MNAMLVRAIILLVFSFGFIGSAQAIVYDFTATDFGAGAPVTDIFGSVTIEGNAVVDIDLTIGTHDYTIGEVGYMSDWIVGGLSCAVNCIMSGTDDFWITGVFSELDPMFYEFAYSMAGVENIFHSGSGTLTARSNSVPAPASLVLFAMGLTMLGFGRRKKV